MNLQPDNMEVGILMSLRYVTDNRLLYAVGNLFYTRGLSIYLYFQFLQSSPLLNVIVQPTSWYSQVERRGKSCTVFKVNVKGQNIIYRCWQGNEITAVYNAKWRIDQH